MLRLALWSTWHRKGALVAAFVALWAAAALITTCGVLLQTGVAGEPRPQRYAGAPVVVTGDQNVHVVQYHKGHARHRSRAIDQRAWLPESALARVAGAPGVRRAVPELSFPANLVSASGRPLGGGPSLGHAWQSASLTPMAIAAGRAPDRAGEIVVDAGTARRAGVRPGDRVLVQSTRAPARYTVSGVTDRGLRGQAALFFAAPEARRLAGHPGQVTAIGVSPASALPAVRDALRGVPSTVRAGNARGMLEFPDASGYKVMLISMGATVGGISLGIAVLVVAGTFTLSIQQRLREIALLRAVAATPKQVRRLIGREALVLAVVAGTAGALCGLGLVAALRRLFVAAGSLPPTLPLSVGLYPVVVAVATVTTAAWAAAQTSAWRANRIRPVESLGEAAAPRPGTARWARVVGAVCLIGFGGVLVVLSLLHNEKGALPVAFGGVVLAAGAVAMFGASLARGTVALTALAARWSPVGGYLAAEANRADHRRLAAVIAPLSLAVSITCTVVFVYTTLGGAAAAQARAGTVGDHVVTGPLGVPAEATAQLRRVPGVRTVTEIVRSDVYLGRDRYAAEGVTPAGVGGTLDVGVREGSLASLADGTVAVSRNAAGAMHAGLGRVLRLELGDGTPVSARVVALYDRGLGFGDVLLPHDQVAAHVDDPRAAQVVVGGGTRAGVAAALGAFPGLRQSGPHAPPAAGPQGGGSLVNMVIMALVVAFTVIAVVNTLAMATAGRRRELALLRLIGTRHRQIRAMLRWEALAVAAVAVAVGTLIALATLAAFSAGITGTVVPHVRIPAYAAVVLAAGALAWAATAVPARAVLRSRPAAGIGIRE
ncbi:ABC transporter permease [Actinomadura verrucosospora]|uniref:ABC transport system integral membrane protein n=1 Tax=Actinomadura verrucosospora TaxID=46165 RepID=A0A7D3ZVD9_ACTVE|nr:ABC transporter permease [Actinomadura verrucosospora]QKG19846.1 ABC transport system integral membrane protein [Actinomadura verrucosospora]